MTSPNSQLSLKRMVDLSLLETMQKGILFAYICKSSSPIIENVLLVDNHMLSISQLCDKGYRVVLNLPNA